MFSPDLWVMLKPKAAYPYLAQLPARTGAWLVLRRPLFFAFVLGCMISLITSGGLSVRLVGSGAACWSFVPLLGIGSLAAVCWSERRIIPLPRAMDLFFTGYGPWSFWLVGSGAFWSSVPVQAYDSTATVRIWLASGVVIMVWSCYIDSWFFRCILKRTSARARRDLLVQRAISWSLGLLIFGAGSLWPQTAGKFGL